MLNQILLSESATTAANGSGGTMTVGEQLILGGSVTVLGMVITFIGLILLIFMTWLYPVIVKAIISRSTETREKREARKAERQLARQLRKEAKEAEATAPAITGQQAVGAPAPLPADEYSPELIAVITAAVAACQGTSSNGIVIRSLRRAQSTTPVWGASSRIEQVNNRL